MPMRKLFIKAPEWVCISALSLLLANSTFSASCAEKFRPGQHLDLDVLKQMKLEQQILGRFLHFLAGRCSMQEPSRQEAKLLTASFIQDTNETLVLADLANAAQVKLAIYSSMPARDRVLWQALKVNCIEKIGKVSDDHIPFMLAAFNRPMNRKAKLRFSTRAEILSRQQQAHHVFDMYLAQADSFNVRAGNDNINGSAVTKPLLNGVNDIDVLADLAGGSYSKWSLYGSTSRGENVLYEFLWNCVSLVAKHPKVEALDVTSYLHQLSTGGAATSEFLDAYERVINGGSFRL
ncbi:hypothetical protein BH11CYA1_BH11CYA1_01480 [soil metagenome]